MVLLPTDPENLTVNAEKFILQVGTNPDQYTVLQDVQLNLERPEATEVVTGNTNTPAVDRITFYGAGDNTLEATMVMSLSEFTTFATTNFLRDANGQMPVNFYRVVMTDRSGNIRTIGQTLNTPPGFKAKLVWVHVTKPVLGGTKYRIRLRLIEDSVTVT